MYDNAIGLFTRGQLDWENTEVRVMLLTDDYEPSQAKDQTLDGLRKYEVTTSGTYKTGGHLLGDRQVLRGHANEILLTGGQVEWTGFTGSFRYAVLRDDNGNLLAYADLGPQSATNTTVGLEYRDGVATFTADTDIGKD